MQTPLILPVLVHTEETLQLEKLEQEWDPNDMTQDDMDIINLDGFFKDLDFPDMTVLLVGGTSYLCPLSRNEVRERVTRHVRRERQAEAVIRSEVGRMVGG